MQVPVHKRIHTSKVVGLVLTKAGLFGGVKWSSELFLYPDSFGSRHILMLACKSI